MATMEDSFTLCLVLGLCLGYVQSDMFTACRDGWVAYQGNCYLFGHHSQRFVEAEHYCRQHNSHLVELHTTEENAFLKSFLAIVKNPCTWIGISDEMIEGSWMWYSSNMKANLTDWYPGEPNGGGDCAVFYSPYHYRWFDYPCSYSCFPLCKTNGFQGEIAAVVG